MPSFTDPLYSVACLLFDTPKPDEASESAGHGLGLKSTSKELSPSSDTRALSMKGGVTAVAAVAAVKTITFSAVAVADETVNVGGKNYIFKPSPAGADEVAHGSTATDSAQNLKAKINTDTATTLCTAAGDAATLTLTANTPGTDFALSETSTVATIATTTPNVVGVTGVKSSILATLAGLRSARTIEEVAFDVNSAGKTRRISCCYKVASSSSSSIVKNSAQAGSALAGLLLSLQNCINGIASDDDNFYLSSDPKDTESDCTAFAQQLFGTDESFSITEDNQLKIEAGATGVNGNNIKIYTSVHPSAPSPLPDVISNGVPQFDEGEVVHAGIFDETKLSNAIQELLIKGSNAFGNLLTIPGDIDDTFSIKLFINNNVDFAAKLLRNGATTFDATRKIFTSTNDLGTRTTGVFLAVKSKTIKGAWNCLWIYDAEITGTIDTSFGLRDVAGYTLTVRVNQDLERSGDPKFVRWVARAL